MKKRRSRAARPPARRYELTTRDRQLVQAVGWMAQATSDQLRRLFFRDPSMAARRLRSLVAHRLLDVHVCSQNDPNVYTLGTGGVELLRASGADLTELHQSKVGRHLDHHLRLLNDLRVELVLGARRRDDVVVSAFHSDLDLRRRSGSPPPAYIPDAIVEIELPTGSLALMVEIDTGTESATLFARTKVATTVTLWTAGEKCWGAVTGSWRPAAFVTTSARAKALARAITRAEGGSLWLIAEFERVRAAGFFGPVFATADAVAATAPRQAVTYSGALLPASQKRSS